MKKFFKLLLGIFVVCLLFLLSSSVYAVTFSPTSDINTFSFYLKYNNLINKFVLEEVNYQRAKEAELPPLKYDYSLQDYADLRAAELQLKYSHERPNGKQALDSVADIHASVGLDIYGWKGGNAAWDYSTDTPHSVGDESSLKSLAKSLVDRWMNSPGHRRNILNETFTHVALATSFSVDEVFLWDGGCRYRDVYVASSVQLFSEMQGTQEYDSHFNPDTWFANNVRTENMVIDSGNGIVTTTPTVDLLDIDNNRKQVKVRYEVRATDSKKGVMDPKSITIENTSLIFESSNPSKVTVDPDGTINLLEDGTVDITIKTSNGVVVGVLPFTVTGHPAKPKPANPSTIRYGDVNMDGEVNIRDIVYLSRHINKWSEYQPIQVFENCDLNQDGVLTIRDVVILSRHVNKWVEYSVLPMQ